MKNQFESAKNWAKVGVVAATIGLSGIPKESNAQIFKHKDKEQSKTEQTVENKKDSTIYNIQDHDGFKYSFDKVYKTDENKYRSVAYGKSMDQMMSKNIAISEAKSKLIQEIGKQEISLHSFRIIDEKQFHNNETGRYTTVVALEIDK